MARPRFSIRTLLFIATIVGICLVVFLQPAWTRNRLESSIRNGDYSLILTRIPVNGEPVEITRAVVLEPENTTMSEFFALRRTFKVMTITSTPTIKNLVRVYQFEIWFNRVN